MDHSTRTLARFGVSTKPGQLQVPFSSGLFEVEPSFLVVGYEETSEKLRPISKIGDARANVHRAMERAGVDLRQHLDHAFNSEHVV
jgi:hypothetical protein